MLTKLKRFYSENSSIGVPNPVSCFKLVSVLLERTSEIEIGESTIPNEVRYILCNDNLNEEVVITVSRNTLDPIELEINSCIKSNSLYIVGENITEEGFYQTDDWDITVDFSTCKAPSPITVYDSQISVSFVEDPEGACSILTPSITIYIETSVVGQINNGDTVYSDSFATVPFNGGNQYYALKLDSQLFKTICLVSTTGVITVSESCL